MSKAEDIKDLMRWFAYSDISPKEGDRALVVIEKEDTAFTAIFTAGPDGFPWVDGTITHWMPLPPEITTRTAPNDTARLDWLGQNPMGLDQVQVLVEDDGSDIRDAIDDVMSGKDVDDEEAE